MVHGAVNAECVRRTVRNRKDVTMRTTEELREEEEQAHDELYDYLRDNGATDAIQRRVAEALGTVTALAFIRGLTAMTEGG